MTKLDLFTVGKLHTVSLCKKSAHDSLFYSMGKNVHIHNDSPSVMILYRNRVPWSKEMDEMTSQGFQLYPFLSFYDIDFGRVK